MKKNILFICALLLSSILFSSCSEDDESGQGAIEVNGVKYPLANVFSMGIWDEESKSGTFTVSTNNLIDGVIYVDAYKFEFDNASAPKVGDEFANMNLQLRAGTVDNNGSIFDDPLSYVSGSAKVVGLNKSESEMTIQFNQLKMDGYTFNGTIAVSFTENW